MEKMIFKAIGSIDIANEDERIVEGYFTDDKVDYVGHIISKEATIRALQDYEAWGNIRDMHDEPVATVVEIGKRAWNHLAVKVHDDNTWKKIKAGIYKGFSVGIAPLRYDLVSFTYIMENTPEAVAGLPAALIEALQLDDYIVYITDYIMGEISIVDRPANPRATISAYKSLGDSGSLISPRVLKYTEETMEDNREFETEVQDVETTEEKEIEVEETKDLTQEAEEIVEDEAVEEVTESEEAVAEDKLEKAIDSMLDMLEKVQGNYETVTARMDDIEKRLDEMAVKEAEAEEDVQEAPEVETTEDKAVEAKEVQDGRFAELEKKLGRLLDKMEGTSNRAGVNREDANIENTEEKPVKKALTYNDLAASIAGAMGDN